MIPYDDLVAALTAWRARQGLPVTAAPTAGSGPTAIPNTGSGSHTAMPGSGPVAAKPGSGPVRGGPPSAPPKTGAYAGAYQPPPLAAPDDSLDVDDAALLEESSYDNEGADFGMAFGNVERNDDESTALGHAPQRDSFGGETELDPGSLAGKPKKPW